MVDKPTDELEAMTVIPGFELMRVPAEIDVQGRCEQCGDTSHEFEELVIADQAAQKDIVQGALIEQGRMRRPSELFHLQIEARLTPDAIDDIAEPLAVSSSVTVLVAAHHHGDASHLPGLLFIRLELRRDGVAHPSVFEPCAERLHAVVALHTNLLDILQ